MDISSEVERVYDEYADDLYKYALMILADHGAAEDAVQQVFVKMMKMRNNILQIESFGSYLKMAVRNECYEIIKKHNRFKKWLTKMSNGPIIESLDKENTNEEERELLQRAIKELPTEQREVLCMKIFENKTFSEIGEIIGVPMNTIASRYRYAMDKLKQIIFSNNVNEL